MSVEKCLSTNPTGGNGPWNCRCEMTPIKPQPAAEDIIEDVQNLDMLANRGGIIVMEDEVHIPRAKLALDFARRGAGFAFWAQMEEWTLERIVSELY